MTSNKRTAETMSGHSARIAEATPRLLVCRVDMLLPTAFIFVNFKSRENATGTLSQPMAIGEGTWSYHCSIHPTMVGTVTITAP